MLKFLRFPGVPQARRPMCTCRFLPLVVLAALGGCAAPTPPPPAPDATALVRRATELLKQSPTPPAVEQLLREAVRADPLNAEAQFLLGAVLVSDKGHEKEGIEFLQRAATLDPANPVRWSALAAACWKGNDVDGQLAAASKALDLNPEQPQMLFMRGVAREAKDDHAGAVEDLLAADRLYPHNADFLYWLGWARCGLKDWAGALAAFDGVLAVSEFRHDARTQRAYVLKKLGRLDEAQAELDRTLEQQPDDATAWSARGDMLADAGRPAEAVAAFTKAIELEPDVASHRLSRGKARFDLHDYAGALADFNEYIRLEPTSDLGYYRRGRLRHEQGDFAGAEEDFARAVQFDPSDYTNWLRRGLARYAQGNLAGALADWSESGRRREDGGEYENFWCHLLARRLGRPDRAAALQATAANAKEPWTRVVAGFLSGAMDEAAFLAAAEAGPADKRNGRRCEALYYAGMARLVEGRDYRELLERCVATGATDYYEHTFAKLELARPAPPAGK